MASTLLYFGAQMALSEGNGRMHRALAFRSRLQGTAIEGDRQKPHPRGTHGNRSMRLFACFALLASAILVAPRSLFAQSRAASFVDSGAITVATGGGVADLDPASIVTAAANVAVTANIDETLVTYNGSRVDRFVPLLATAWQSNADRSVWTFHLRHAVKFHLPVPWHGRRYRTLSITMPFLPLPTVAMLDAPTARWPAS